MKPIFKILIFVILGLFLVGGFVFAQYGLEKFKEVKAPIVETEKSIPQVVGGVVKWILGIIGVILVVLIVYGGVMYATSAGNEERVKKARNVLTYSIVGVTVIALAFLITDYVVSALFPGAGKGGKGVTGEGLGGVTIEEGQTLIIEEGQALIDQGNAAIAEGEDMIKRGQGLIAQGNEEEGRRLIEEGEKRRQEGIRLKGQGEEKQYQAKREEEARRKGAEIAAYEEAGRCNKACERCSVFNAECCAGYECRSDVEGGLSEWLPYGAVCVKVGTESGGACCRLKGDICGPAQIGDCCEGLVCQGGKCITASKGATK